MPKAIPPTNILIDVRIFWRWEIIFRFVLLLLILVLILIEKLFLCSSITSFHRTVQRVSDYTNHTHGFICICMHDIVIPAAITLLKIQFKTC